jgi:hypothetical protein
MVNNASDRTFDLLNERIKNPFRCIAILEKLLNSKRKDAQDILKKEKIPSRLIKEILDDLYKKPAPGYFIVEKSMIPKMPQISFLGGWDFRKLYVRENVRKGKKEILKDLAKVFGLTPEVSNTLYQEAVLTAIGAGINEGLSQRRKFYTPLTKGKKKGNLIYFDNGLIYDLNAEGAILFFHEGRYRIPKYAFVFKDGKITEMNFEDSDADISVLVIAENEEYNSIFLDRELATSLFSRLYFMKGKGLKYFEPFYSDDEAHIYVYRIKWEEFDGHQ